MGSPTRNSERNNKMTYEQRYAKVQNKLITALARERKDITIIQLAVKKIREIQTQEMYENLHKQEL